MLNQHGCLIRGMQSVESAVEVRWSVRFARCWELGLPQWPRANRWYRRLVNTLVVVARWGDEPSQKSILSQKLHPMFGGLQQDIIVACITAY